MALFLLTSHVPYGTFLRALPKGDSMQETSLTVPISSSWLLEALKELKKVFELSELSPGSFKETYPKLFKLLEIGISLEEFSDN